jgi:hypothetical protein
MDLEIVLMNALLGPGARPNGAPERSKPICHTRSRLKSIKVPTMVLADAEASSESTAKQASSCRNAPFGEHFQCFRGERESDFD